MRTTVLLTREAIFYFFLLLLSLSRLQRNDFAFD